MSQKQVSEKITKHFNYIWVKNNNNNNINEMLTLTKKMSHVTLIGTFSHKGTQGQTAAEPVWAFKMGRHETLSC